MRRQSLIALGAAIFFGLIAVFLVNAYLSGSDREREQAAQATTVKVAVAQVPLPFGEKLTPEKVRFVDWPTSSVPPGALQSPTELSEGGEPRVVLRPLEPGEPIMRAKISGEGGRAALSAVLPADKRAVSIPITDVAGVAGFVLPGDRVDVLLTQGGGDAQATDVLLQDVRVIAIDQNSDEKAAGTDLGRTATVEAEPYDAQKLVLAQQVGTLSLALRSAKAEPGDAYAGAVSRSELGSGGFAAIRRPANFTPYSTPPLRARPPVRRAAPTPAPRPATNSVEIVRGLTGSKYEVSPYGGR